MVPVVIAKVHWEKTFFPLNRERIKNEGSYKENISYYLTSSLILQWHSTAK